MLGRRGLKLKAQQHQQQQQELPGLRGVAGAAAKQGPLHPRYPLATWRCQSHSSRSLQVGCWGWARASTAVFASYLDICTHGTLFILRRPLPVFILPSIARKAWGMPNEIASYGRSAHGVCRRWGGAAHRHAAISRRPRAGGADVKLQWPHCGLSRLTLRLRVL